MTTRRRHVAAAVSVAGATVDDMADIRIHTCIYFDDGAEHLCACGSRAMYLVEEDGMDAVLVELLDTTASAPVVAADFARELAVSA